MSGEIDIFANNTQRKGKQAVLKRMVLLLLMLQQTQYPFRVSQLSIKDPQLCPRVCLKEDLSSCNELKALEKHYNEDIFRPYLYNLIETEIMGIYKGMG